MVEKVILDRLLQKVHTGGVAITYWDGETRTYGPQKKPTLTVKINDPKVVRAIAKNLSLGIGEAYMEGTLEVTGPLDQLFAFGIANEDVLGRVGGNRVFKGFNRNHKSTQSKLIQTHYDLGNDFYELWLDPETLGYTCSYYKTPEDTLEMGQVQKFDHVLNKLRLQPDHTLLDIGFGWGYLLIRAAKRFGVKGFGVSLSREQLAYARDWAKREKVDHLVTFELMNYQDLPQLRRQFDRVVSIGFFEHVGGGNHENYFQVVDTMLADQGVSVLHCITQLQDLPVDAWIDRYIFPGGYIPSIPHVTKLMSDKGFVLKDYENIGPHYGPTLREWWRRFEQHKDQVIAMYDERFYRMWRYYLASSMVGFDTGVLNLSQWTFTRLPATDWPLTREYLYVPPGTKK